MTAKQVDDISFGDVARGIITEQALCLSRKEKRFKKYIDELYDEAESYFKLYHKTNWSKNWKKIIQTHKTKYRKIVAIIFMRILIADTLQTNKIFKKKQDNLLDNVIEEVNRVNTDISRGEVKNVQYNVYKTRLGFTRLCVVRGGTGKQLQENIRLDNSESMINAILRYECEQLLKVTFSQFKEKYEMLQKELESYKQKISERSGRGGKYTYEYAMALTRVFQKMDTTEQKTIDGINESLNLLPESMHANQLIPKIPCRQTCATLRDALIKMFIDDALNNGNKYGYGICTDAGAIPSKTKIKLLPFMIVIKYVGEACEDYRLNLYLKSMIPHDRASENAITTAENIINLMKTWPLGSVASVYIADTASTETKTAELIRSGDPRIEGIVFTRLMAFAVIHYIY